MNIIYNTIIPVKGFLAMNLFGLIFARPKLKTLSPYYKDIVIRHEEIHTEQYKELLYLFFLVWYGLEYVIKLLFCWNFKEAYKSVSFEQEANLHETDENYLNNRKHYAWTKWIFKMWQ